MKVVHGDEKLKAVSGIRNFTDLEIGERVYSISTAQGFEKTIAEGIISGLLSEPRIIQTTAPISPGSSGGGLFDNSGNLIGITFITRKESQNINFAIAADSYFE